MKAISFLGPTDYKETTYTHSGTDGERTFRTRFFAEAMLDFYPEVDAVYVLLTPIVQNHANWTELQQRLGDKAHGVPIPSGHSEAELWQILDALTAIVEPGDTVLFDITNSFRSLPFLTFLAAAYLRTARSVKVKAVIYGAFEARDMETGHTPVFDLTPFVTLLDWITATNQFIYTGDGRYLAKLLQVAGYFEHPRRRLTPEEQVQQDAARRIGSAAGAIEETSKTLLATLIPNAELASHKLITKLAQAEADLAAQAPPYRLLAERIRETYAPFAAEKPMDGDLLADLKLQLAMVRWYLDKNHLPQAITLMREWVVSAFGYYIGIRDAEILDNKRDGTRERIEIALGWANGTQQNPEALHTPPNTEAEKLKVTPFFTSLAIFWNKLTNIRNTIDHGAMRTHWQDLNITTIIENTEDLHAELEKLSKTLLEDECSS